MPWMVMASSSPQAPASARTGQRRNMAQPRKAPTMLLAVACIIALKKVRMNTVASQPQTSPVAALPTK